MKQGLVSVVMPVYNAADTVLASVQSVQRQTYPDWELVVVDDGSRDASVEIVSGLAEKDPRIRLFLQKQNGGVAAARNRGIAEAQGQYLAFLDSDDLWRPEKLTKQISFMQAHHAALCATAYGVSDENGKKAGADRRFPGVESIGRSDDTNAERISTGANAGFRTYDFRQLLKGNALGCLTVMIDREALREQGYTGEIAFPQINHEDYALWLSILRGDSARAIDTGSVAGSDAADTTPSVRTNSDTTGNGLKAYALDEVLADYRLDSRSVSGNKWKSAKWTYEIYRNYLGLGKVESLRCFLGYLFSAVAKRV